MERHVRASIIAPGWGSVNLSQFTHHWPKFGYYYREGRGESLITVECSLTLIHWLEPPFFSSWWSEPTLAVWSEGLAKSPYQTNTPSTVRLEPAIYRLQTQALTNWAILASYDLLSYWVLDSGSLVRFQVRAKPLSPGTPSWVSDDGAK